MNFHCPQCQQLLSADPSQANQVVACPHCQTQIQIPPASAFQPIHSAYRSDPFQQPTGSSGKWIWISLAGLVLLFGLSLLLAFAWMAFRSSSPNPSKLARNASELDGTSSSANRSTLPAGAESDSNTGARLSDGNSSRAPVAMSGKAPLLRWNLDDDRAWFYKTEVRLSLGESSKRWNGLIHYDLLGPVSNQRDKNGMPLPTESRGIGLVVAPKYVIVPKSIAEGKPRIDVHQNEATAQIVSVEPIGSTNWVLGRLNQSLTPTTALAVPGKNTSSNQKVFWLYLDRDNGLQVIEANINATAIFNGALKNLGVSPAGPAQNGNFLVNQSGQIIALDTGMPGDRKGNFVTTLIDFVPDLQRKSIKIPEAKKVGSGQVATPDSLKQTFQDQVATVIAKRPQSADAVYSLGYHVKLKSQPSLQVRTIGDLRRLSFRGLGSNQWFIDHGHISLDRQGQVFGYTGNTMLPATMELAGLLPLMPFPEKPARGWTYEEPLQISFETENSNDPGEMMRSFHQRQMRDLMEGRAPNPMANPFAPQPRSQLASSTGKTTREFTLIDRDGTRITIHEHLQTDVNAKRGEIQATGLSGNAEHVFDTQTGKLIETVFKGEFRVQSKGITVAAPISWTMHLTTAEEVAAERAQAIEAAKQREFARNHVTDAEQAEVVDALQSNDLRKLYKTLRILESKTNPEPNATVSRALLDRMANGRPLYGTDIERQHSNILSKWLTDDDLEQAVALCRETSSDEIKTELARVFLQRKLEETYPMILETWNFIDMPRSVSSCLKPAMGSTIEDDVLEEIAQFAEEFNSLTDLRDQMAAKRRFKNIAKLVGEIGTEKSLKFIEENEELLADLAIDLHFSVMQIKTRIGRN